MSDGAGEREQIALDYSRSTPPRSSWPVALYTCALIWAFVTMRMYTAMTTSYRAESIAELRTQLPLLACAAIRLAWARHRREQGRGWVFYVVLLFLAPLVWSIIAPALDRIGRMLWGGPLIP